MKYKFLTKIYKKLIYLYYYVFIILYTTIEFFMSAINEQGLAMAITLLVGLGSSGLGVIGTLRGYQFNYWIPFHESSWTDSSYNLQLF